MHGWQRDALKEPQAFGLFCVLTFLQAAALFASVLVADVFLCSCFCFLVSLSFLDLVFGQASQWHCLPRIKDDFLIHHTVFLCLVGSRNRAFFVNTGSLFCIRTCYRWADPLDSDGLKERAKTLIQSSGQQLGSQSKTWVSGSQATIHDKVHASLGWW